MDDPLLNIVLSRLDQQTLAFLSFDYQVSPKGIPFRRQSSEAQLRQKLLFNSVLVQYRLYGGKYYLHHVLTVWRADMDYTGKQSFSLHPFEMKTNYIVTRIDTGTAARFAGGKKLSENELVENHTSEDRRRKHDYWDSYNYLEAEFNVDSAFRVIREHNK